MRPRFAIANGQVIDTRFAVYDPDVGAVVAKDRGRRQVPRAQQARIAATILAEREAAGASPQHPDPCPF